MEMHHRERERERERERLNTIDLLPSLKFWQLNRCMWVFLLVLCHFPKLGSLGF